MQRETSRYSVFSRRAALLMSGKAALATVLAGRMYYLQVIESDQYAVLADENRIHYRMLAPQRGRILDRFGVELANNTQNLRALIVAEQAGDVAKVLTRLRDVVPVGDHEERRILREIKRRRSFVPVSVVENLSWEQFAALNVHLPHLPGIQLEIGETRGYPKGETFSHLIGYVAAVAEADLTGDPLLELPGMKIGKNGVEKLQDEPLRGKAGSQRVEVNAIGRVIRELSRDHGERGADIALTIDAGLQEYAADRVDGESASVVVIDCVTGELLTLVSVPGYDPTPFTTGLSQRLWQELVSNPLAPLVNKSIAGQYPPGSTFKMLVALAALESGLATPDHRVGCSGSIELGTHEFHCWKKKPGHGALRMVEAIEQSCDVYFYDLARKVGIDRIAEMGRRFGLGQSFRIGLPGERPGLMPTRDWKKATYGQPWHPGDNLNAGIGQGYVLSTPLQLAVMAARLGGGRMVTPRVVRSVGDMLLPRPEAPVMAIKPEFLKVVQDGMVRVVNGGAGTAKRAKLPDNLGVLAGKTGSSQVRRISKAERQTRVRKNEEKPWIERDHAWFVCYAPAETPRYACCVLVEHGGSGSGAAAPVARDVMAEVMRRDPARRMPGERMAGQDDKRGA
ncbi:MAG: penicillin-binding protein 2 [Alphaproteobacteria bacterium]|nr:penicillin-binding protein 2 [Alphaproteobacteria bacterium]